MNMPGRGFESDEHRFGFNGMEQDDEVKGAGNSLNFGARIYDSRLGRWLSRDPLETKYPGVTPYSFSLNSPQLFKDPDGRDAVISIYKTESGDIVISISTTVHVFGDSPHLSQKVAQLNAMFNNLNTAVVIPTESSTNYIVSISQRFKENNDIDNQSALRSRRNEGWVQAYQKYENGKRVNDGSRYWLDNESNTMNKIEGWQEGDNLVEIGSGITKIKRMYRDQGTTSAAFSVALAKGLADPESGRSAATLSFSTVIHEVGNLMGFGDTYIRWNDAGSGLTPEGFTGDFVSNENPENINISHFLNLIEFVNKKGFLDPTLLENTDIHNPIEYILRFGTENNKQEKIDENGKPVK